jgi:serine/threonine-protein kinase RsbW
LPLLLPNSSQAELRLTVLNELASIEPARQEVLAFVASSELPAALIYKLELVLEETLMNRVWHAFPQGGRHMTDLTVQLDADALVLCFEDDGIAVNPMQVPVPPRPSSIQEAVPGGLGLLLTRKAASSCEYTRIDGRNRFRVRLNIR